MKVWIVGAQCTCKKEIADLLAEEKFKVGHLFTNIAQDVPIYHKELYKYYGSEDIKSIFENNAYVFINNIFDGQDDAYDGLDFSEYDDNNVFVLSIDQFLSVNTKYISKDDLVVWVDGDKNWRYSNINSDSYDVGSRERIEKSQYVGFFNLINTLKTSTKNVLYFLNEEPVRVKTIIKIIANNPKLKQEFIRNFS